MNVGCAKAQARVYLPACLSLIERSKSRGRSWRHVEPHTETILSLAEMPLFDVDSLSGQCAGLIGDCRSFVATSVRIRLQQSAIGYRSLAVQDLLFSICIWLRGMKKKKKKKEKNTLTLLCSTRTSIAKPTHVKPSRTELRTTDCMG